MKRQVVPLGNFKDIHKNRGEHSSLWYHSNSQFSGQFTYLSEGANESLLLFCFWKRTVPLYQSWGSYSHLRSNLSFKEMSLTPCCTQSLLQCSPLLRLSSLRMRGLTCTGAWCLVCVAKRNGEGTGWKAVWAPGSRGTVVKVMVPAGKAFKLSWYRYPSAFLQIEHVLRKRNNSMGVWLFSFSIFVFLLFPMNVRHWRRWREQAASCRKLWCPQVAAVGNEFFKWIDPVWGRQKWKRFSYLLQCHEQ